MVKYVTHGLEAVNNSCKIGENEEKSVSILFDDNVVKYQMGKMKDDPIISVFFFFFFFIYTFFLLRCNTSQRG